MYAGRIGLGWAHDVFTVAYHMLMHFSCICTFISLYSYIDLCWCFSIFLSLSLYALASSMAPKHKSAPSQNPLHSGASSFDPIPSHIQFHDDKAWKDFSKNFSWRGIHSERQVIPLDFSNIDLPTVIYSRGWESLCGIPVTCLFVII